MSKIILIVLINLKKKFSQLRRIGLLLKLRYLRNNEIINDDIETSIIAIENYRKKHINHDICFINKKRTCKLSIIIPVYNAEKYIATCLDSISNQKISYPYEVICINDGSSDNSLQIIQNYNKINLKVFSQNNSGAGKARNKGLDEAQGEYIFFIDSDDILPLGAINKMLETAMKSNADIISGIIGKTNADSSMIYYPKKKKDIQTNDLIVACNLMTGTPWGKLYKSYLWNDIRFPEYYAYEDTIIFLNIFAKAKVFFVLGSPVYCFRSVNDSLFKRENLSNRCVDIIWVIKDALDYTLNIPVSSYNKYYQILIWHLSVVLYARLKRLNNEEILKNAFIIAIDINKIFLSHCPCEVKFIGKNAYIYYKVYKSFVTKDYLLWMTCCKALKNSEAI